MVNIIVTKHGEVIHRFPIDPQDIHQTLWDMFGYNEVKVKFNGKHTLFVEIGDSISNN